MRYCRGRWTVWLWTLWAGVAQGGVPIVNVLNNDHDFGTAWIGAKLDYTYQIRNDGDAVLEILGIRSTCPCSSVDAGFPRKIAPGETGRFTLRLDTARSIYGTYQKSIELITNVPRASRTALRFRGEVREYIERSRARVGFGRIGSEQTELQIVELTNNTDELVILELMGPPRQGVFEATLRDVAPGKAWRLEIRATPPYEPYQNHVVLRISTSLAQQPVVTIDCSAYVTPRLELSPPYLVKNAKLGVRKVRLINHGTTPVHVQSIESDDRRIKTAFVETRAGFEYEMIIAMPLGFSPSPDGNVITIRTDDGETPELILRFVRTAAKQASRPQSP